MIVPASIPRALGAFAALLLLGTATFPASAAPLEPDLTGIPAEQGWKLINRSAVLIDHDGARAVRLEGDNGTGFARLQDLEFSNGTIEFDARGRDVAQQSFLGLAFHGADVRTYDAVYFRPFNFRAAEPARRKRAVQYISHPTHTWQRLREQSPGKYEAAVTPAPDPNAWFHVRLVVAAPTISVFVNDATEPCLVVSQLNQRQRGWVALWTDVKGGDFASLKITPAAR